MLQFPTDHLDPEQVRLAFGFGDSPGGYKTPALLGLYWSPPYLHDGGVAVGPNGEPGLPATVYSFVRPDPEASLRALVDRELRARVVAANGTDPRLRLLNVSGEGHRYWVDDATGFTANEQRALVLYLLSYAPDPETPLPRPAPAPPLLRAALSAIRQSRRRQGGLRPPARRPEQVPLLTEPPPPQRLWCGARPDGCPFNPSFTLGRYGPTIRGSTRSWESARLRLNRRTRIPPVAWTR